MSNGTTFCLNPTYYIGMDLHSNNVVVCILQNAANNDGSLTKKVIRRAKVKLSPDLSELYEFLLPFCKDHPHQATVESTYNWYNVADLFEMHQWNLSLADPTTVKNNKIKLSNDETDAEFLANQMRLGALKAAQIITKKNRAFRDLVRLRVDLVLDRGRYRTILKNFFNNQKYMKISTTQLNRLADECFNGRSDCLSKYFDEPNVATKAEHYLLAMHQLSSQIEALETLIKEQEQCNNLTCHQYLARLCSIKGCGFILASIIASEIVDIHRFRSDRDFVSYCRLSPAIRISNEKDKGKGEKKNGNAYLSWAMTELANLMVRFNPEVKKKYDRLFKKSRLRAKAIRSLAAKIARCIWHMLMKNEDFEIQRAFI